MELGMKLKGSDKSKLMDVGRPYRKGHELVFIVSKLFRGSR